MNASNGRANELSLNLPAAHRGVRIARSVLGRFARMQGMSQGDADAMSLVASELLANAVDHGGGGAAMTEEDLAEDIRMRASLVIESNRWTLSVTDEGRGDPDEVNRLLAASSAFDLEDDRGRGLFLLKMNVDELEVQRSSDGRGLTFRAQKAYGRPD